MKTPLYAVFLCVEIWQWHQNGSSVAAQVFYFCLFCFFAVIERVKRYRTINMVWGKLRVSPIHNNMSIIHKLPCRRNA
ncbi:hypothetical protein ACVGW2_00255, partial [Enterobacter intestinihominis]